jgi:hypothetical protein
MEECDKGGDDPDCDGDCTFPACGDGYVNTAAGEACEDENGINTDDCPDGPGGTCRAATCGDRFTWTGQEDCDTGGDSMTCDGDCTFVVCGDGRTNAAAGETCDDNDDNTRDACPSGEDGTCRVAFCGDGFVWDQAGGTEDCDDAGDSSTCDRDCTPAVCGDGYRNPAADETCDDGNNNDNDACPDNTGTCQNAFCGDGFVRTGVEDCDRGGDHAECDGDCTPVACGDGYPNPVAGEACDDGNNNDNDACPDNLGTCQAAFCGDGFTWVGMEACDDAGDSIMCDGDCTPVECGDGYVNTVAEEECESNADCDGIQTCVGCSCV